MNDINAEYEKLLAKEEKRKEVARKYYLKKRYGINETVVTSSDILLRYAGKLGTIELGKFLMRVRILNAKNEYGRLRLLVEPLEGTGQNWVQNVIIDS